MGEWGELGIGLGGGGQGYWKVAYSWRMGMKMLAIEG